MSVDLDKVKENLEELGFSSSLMPLYFTSSPTDLANNKSNFALKVNLPAKYEKLPEMPELTSSMFHKISDNDMIVMYFLGIKMGTLNIKCINYIEPKLVSTSQKKCNYCGINICKTTSSNGCATLKNNAYYYCFDCNKSMCPLCHSETNVVIAAKHKANLEKYEQRQPMILACLQHNIKYIPAHVSCPQANCDVCGDKINILENVATGNNDYNILGKMGTKWYYCRDNDVDVCMNCSETNEGKKQISKHKLQIGYYSPICDYLNFGSIMDWIPIFVTHNTDYILYNANKNSEYYQRIAYCNNNNGFKIYVTDDNYSIRDSQDIIKTFARLQRTICNSSACFNFGLIKRIEQPKTQYTPYSAGLLDFADIRNRF